MNRLKSFIQENKSARKALFFLGIGLTLFVVFLTVIYPAYVYIRFALDKPAIVSDVEYYKKWLYGQGESEKTNPIRIYSRDLVLIGEMLPERGSHVDMKGCSSMTWLRRAAVSSEDRWFFEHHGVSLRGVARAFWNNLRSFRIREGAGSISMQLARNLFTNREDSLYRKIYETYTAFLLENRLSKDEILCLYLNKIYMGEGRVGAEEASWYYFRKPPGRLNEAESAMIVGLFPSPVRYSPENNIHLSLVKQKMVLNTMKRDGWLDDKQIDASIKKFKKRYQVKDEKESLDSGSIGAYGASRDFRLHHPAPAVNEYVRQFIYSTLSEEDIKKGNIKVITTINSVKQAAAIQGIRQVVGRLREKYKSPELAERLNGVMVVLDPFLGEIQAMVGGYRVSEGGSMTTRIFRMRRQPGSAIKGILYATALDERVLVPEKVMVDEQIQIGNYKPSNWYNSFLGPVTLRTAVARSINTIAVQTIQDLGVDRFRRKLGVGLGISQAEARERFADNPTLALGSGELTPMELTRLYGSLLNGGWSIEPSIVKVVKNNEGKKLWEAPVAFSGSVRIFSSEAAAESLYLMRGVLDDPEGTAYSIGQALRKVPELETLDMAGKTGTVQSVPRVLRKFPGLRGNHDAWFAGLIPSEAAIVWIGQDDGAPIPASGSTAAGVWYTYGRTVFPMIQDRGEFPAVYIPETDLPPPAETGSESEE